MPQQSTQQMMSATCSDHGHIDILAIGSDSHIYHGSWNGKAWQSGWDSLGGSFASLTPSLVSWAPDRLGAFGIDQKSGKLLYKSRNDTVWDSDWINLGGPTLEKPVAAHSWRIDLFGVGASHRRVYHQTFSDLHWRATWEDLGGVSIANPAATSWSSERLNLMVIGSDNAMWHRAWDYAARDKNAGWGEWETLNGSFMYDPAMVSWSANRLDMFVIDTNSSMLFRGWEDDNWTAEWLSLGNHFISSPSLVSWGPGRLDVFALDKWQSMLHRAFDDKWNRWQPDFSYIPGKPFSTIPLAVSCDVGRLDVFAVEESHGLVWHTSWILWNTSTGSESYYDGTKWAEWQSIGRLSIIGATEQALPPLTSTPPNPTGNVRSTSRTAQPPAASNTPSNQPNGCPIRENIKRIVICALMAVWLVCLAW